MNINEVRLAGHLTRDPELRYTPKGAAIANIGIAVNHRWKTEGEKREKVVFVDCTAFGKTAETIAKLFQKGAGIYVSGRLEFDSWEDKQTKAKRSKLYVVVDGFQFTGGKDDPFAANPEREKKEAVEDKPIDDDGVPF